MSKTLLRISAPSALTTPPDDPGTQPPAVLGPAIARLRAHLARHRRTLPGALRWSLWLGAGMTTLYGAILLALFVFHPPLFRKMVTFLVLTVFSGREPAMLMAYQGSFPAPVAWVIVTSIVNDLGALLVVVPLFWLALERLRQRPLIGGLLLSLEKTAFEHRRFIDRWGLIGLVLFAWTPAYGGGILTAGILGVLARVPVKRLLVALSVAIVGIISFWGFVLRYASELLPSEGAWKLLPFFIVGAFVSLSLVAGLRARRSRKILLLEKLGVLEPEHLARLNSVGISDAADVLRVNCEVLGSRLGLPAGPLTQCRIISGLLLLPSLSARHAKQLNAVGIESIRDVAITPPTVIRDALEELEPVPSPGGRLDVAGLLLLATQWHDDASRFVALTRPSRQEQPIRMGRAVRRPYPAESRLRH